MTFFIFGYFVAINLLSLYAMYSDKQKAKRGSWRIPESNLFFLCLAGGFIGIFLGMKYFRHKTKHWQFHTAVIIATLFWVIGVPLFSFVYLR